MAIAGRTVIYDGNFTNTDLPILVPPTEVDPLPTLGTLFYSDPAYPDHEWTVGSNNQLTTTTTTTTNVAAVEAATLLDADPADLSGSISASGSVSKRFSGLTGKGGAYGMIIPTTPVAGTYFALGLPDAVKTYLEANPKHSYYSALSHRITYAQDPALRNGFGGVTYSDAQALYAFRTDVGTLPPDSSTANYIGSTRLGTTDDSESGLVFRSIGATGVGGGTFAGKFSEAWAWMAGRRSPWIGAGEQLAPSNILYFTYLEDLTVSGRTFAEVDALAQAQHTKLHSEGGRYHGDTWTDPADYFDSAQATTE